MKLTSKTFGWMTLWLLSVQPIFSATITFTINPSTSNGAITPYAGTGFNTVSAAPVPRALNELDNPVAVAVDPSGSVYVADLVGSGHDEDSRPFCARHIP